MRGRPTRVQTRSPGTPAEPGPAACYVGTGSGTEIRGAPSAPVPATRVPPPPRRRRQGRAQLASGVNPSGSRAILCATTAPAVRSRGCRAFLLCTGLQRRGLSGVVRTIRKPVTSSALPRRGRARGAWAVRTVPPAGRLVRLSRCCRAWGRAGRVWPRTSRRRPGRGRRHAGTARGTGGPSRRSGRPRRRPAALAPRRRSGTRRRVRRGRRGPRAC